MQHLGVNSRPGLFDGARYGAAIMCKLFFLQNEYTGLHTQLLVTKASSGSLYVSNSASRTAAIHVPKTACSVNKKHNITSVKQSMPWVQEERLCLQYIRATRLALALMISEDFLWHALEFFTRLN